MAREVLTLFDDAATVGASCEGVRPSDAPVSLRRVEEAAMALGRARARLDGAVRDARRAGWSWRRIGAAANIPHQTAHERWR